MSPAVIPINATVPSRRIRNATAWSLPFKPAAIARAPATLADTALCADLAVLVKFFADRRIALDGGRDIVIYLPDGWPIGRRRGYEGEVFNPRDGSVLPLTFSPPRGQDWVVWLRAK